MKHNYNLKKTLGIVTFFVVFSSTFAQSPGGVPASAWYKADAQNTVFSDAGTINATDNSAIEQWNEYLGTGHNLTQTSTGSQPTYSNATTLVNFNPTISFDLDYLEYQPSTGIDIIDRANGTLYTAGYFNTVGAAGIVGFDASMDYPGLHTSNNGLDNLLFYTGGPGYQGLTSNSFSDNNYFIAGANWENAAGASAAYASSIVSLDGIRSSYNNTELQNAVTPNGDGVNDYFMIDQSNNECARDIHVEVYNRWGVKVFETDNYDTSGNVFDGFSNGRLTVDDSKQLPTGTYFYILTYNYGQGGTAHRFKKAGYLYLNGN